MIVIPPYKKFKKSDIELNCNGYPLFNFPTQTITPILIEGINFLTKGFGFPDPIISIDRICIVDDIRTWNVVKVKKFRQLTIAIYDLLEVDYVEL